MTRFPLPPARQTKFEVRYQRRGREEWFRKSFMTERAMNTKARKLLADPKITNVRTKEIQSEYSITIPKTETL